MPPSSSHCNTSDNSMLSDRRLSRGNESDERKGNSSALALHSQQQQQQDVPSSYHYGQPQNESFRVNMSPSVDNLQGHSQQETTTNGSFRTPSADVSRLAHSRYVRAVEYANYQNNRNSNPSPSPSNHGISTSMARADRRSPVSNTSPLKPPAYSNSTEVPSSQTKTVSPVPVTPPSKSIPSVSSCGSTTSCFAQSSADALEWRKHGKRVRALLVLEDEQKGGSTFQLSNACSVERYYRVAERVSDAQVCCGVRLICHV